VRVTWCARLSRPASGLSSLTRCGRALTSRLNLLSCPRLVSVSSDRFAALPTSSDSINPGVVVCMLNISARSHATERTKSTRRQSILLLSAAHQLRDRADSRRGSSRDRRTEDYGDRRRRPDPEPHDPPGQQDQVNRLFPGQSYLSSRCRYENVRKGERAKRP
jgi:hypothetical protein